LGYDLHELRRFEAIDEMFRACWQRVTATQNHDDWGIRVASPCRHQGVDRSVRNGMSNQDEIEATPLAMVKSVPKDRTTS
jgi:hypothetical protein